MDHLGIDKFIDRLLHQRALHLEPARTRAEPAGGGSAGAAERIAPDQRDLFSTTT
jgi:hypothetical protein